MSESYVILTGSKNNAGDFLIKHRAKKLFKELRSDREIIDVDGWLGFDESTLELINSSKALILLGGPSLQKNMYPGIYPLIPELNKIQVPVTTMGVGWKSIRGNWSDTYDYPLSPNTLDLLNKCSDSGLPMSVRDYHTQSVLFHKGFNNALMTGCPAYYDLNNLSDDYDAPTSLNKVVFSLGVSFIESKSMMNLMKEQILRCRDRFSSSKYIVAFHHSLNTEEFMGTHGASLKHNLEHIKFRDWLVRQKIDYKDISGSAENLIEFYSSVDLHIGYRVHAHIFMSSIGKLSYLIAEDGRAKGSKEAIGGLVSNGYNDFQVGLLSKVMNRLVGGYDRYTANINSTKEVLMNIDYEINNNFHRVALSKNNIQKNFKLMSKFIKKLP